MTKSGMLFIVVSLLAVGGLELAASTNRVAPESKWVEDKTLVERARLDMDGGFWVKGEGWNKMPPLVSIYLDGGNWYSCEGADYCVVHIEESLIEYN